MWMMGCSDGGEFSMPESFNGRKLRPLMPRTPMAPSNTSPPRLGLPHGNNIFSLNHHLANMTDQSKRDFHTQQVVVSSRWNPTPEQLRTLEELYRRGTRTPSTEQIQHITAQLRKYGKIEGKNVFYWFQNHKARERQKRRRQMESAITSDNEQNQQQQHQQFDIEMFERKESGGNEQIKNWAISTNCSTLPEESIQRAAAKGGGNNNNNNNNVTECREGWYQLDEMEFQNRKNFIDRNATWQQMMQLSCPSQLINTTSATLCNISTTSTTSSSSALISDSTKAKTKTNSITTMDPMLIKTTNIFISPNYYTQFNQQQDEENNGCGEFQTLQLFPLRSNAINEAKHSINDNDQTDTSYVSFNANSAQPQFIEFLPVKN